MATRAPSRDLHGSTAFVTGATSGLGLETARALAARGAHVVLGARTAERGEQALELLRADDARAVYSVAVGDLSTRDGVLAIAEHVLDAHPILDVLVNNAGTVRASRHVTADGLEWTWAVNHLAPFLLTRLLIEALGDSGRVVIVTSDAHRDVTLDLDDLESRDAYDPLVAYRRSKLANLLFARALAARAPQLSVTAVAPGIVASEIVREAPAALRAAWAARGRSAADGARWIVDAAGMHVPDAAIRYFSEGREMPPSLDAQDDRLAERLWEISAAQTRTPPSPVALTL